jgi:hypothetical protein
VIPPPSRWFIRNYIAPDSTGTRAKAPKKITPTVTVRQDCLQKFLATNDRARELIMRASNYDVNRIRFKDPFMPLVRFTVGVGLEIVFLHQARHLQQAEMVRNSPDFPTAEIALRSRRP